MLFYILLNVNEKKKNPSKKQKQTNIKNDKDRFEDKVKDLENIFFLSVVTKLRHQPKV